MAWISSTIATVLPVASLGVDPDPKALAGSHMDEEHYVFTHSRRGAVLRLLRDICDSASTGSDLYLFANSALLHADEARQAADAIQALIQAIESNPDIVLEATKLLHEVTTEVSAAGFEPREFEVVYPEGASFRDHWVYYYNTDEVLELLQNAVVSSDPCPPHDDEGEGLEYAFGVLKSHLALLRHAVATGQAFVYAEMNELDG